MARLFGFGKRKPQRRGVLTLEWILLVTVIVIGIIGGLGAVRSATLASCRTWPKPSRSST